MKPRHQKRRSQREDWTPIERKNPRYEQYYRLQKVCADEEELQTMMEAFRTPLPAAFRVTYGCDLRQTAIQNLTDQKGDEAPKELAWYPNHLAYGWDALVRKEIRKDPKLQELKRALIGEAERGAVVRQEAVSMIPPIFIDMKASSACLDMCAAPGSKTSQLLDLALVDQGDFDRLDCQMPEDTAVIANDVNLTRARMLCHQVQRLGHPGAAISYMDASAFPKADQASLLFDRVLADVPCSGDGTLRKNIDIWAKWTPRGAMQLHDRQLQILLRGMSLVSPGGIVVYSTCSLNPIEDEAVVAAALKANPAFELLPVEREGLKRKSGLTEWVVPNPVKFEKPDIETCEIFEKFEDFADANAKLDERWRMKTNLIQETMFSSSIDEEIRSQLPKCGRFLPHQNNSGGFFVAILRNTATEPTLKKPRYDRPVDPQSNNIDEYFKMQLLETTDPECSSILNWYGLTATETPLAPVAASKLVAESAKLPDGKDMSFFKDPRERIRDMVKDFKELPLVTKDNKEKRIYMATPRLIRICVNARQACKFLQCGVKAFERLDEKFASSSGCAYRPMGESATWLVPCMRRRLIFMTYGVAMSLLEDQMSKIQMLQDEKEGNIVSLDPLRRQAEDSELNFLEPGGFIAVCSNEIEAQLNPESPRQLGTLRISCLMSAHGNIQPLVRKAIREALLVHLDEKSSTEEISSAHEEISTSVHEEISTSVHEEISTSVHEE